MAEYSPLLSSKVNYTAFELLLHETIPLAIRVQHDKATTEAAHALLGVKSPSTHTLETSATNTEKGTGNGSASQQATSQALLHVNEMGFTVGYRLAILLLHADPTDDMSLVVQPTNILAIVKFICRSLWKALYLKPIDNLRTNHRGTFVLLDNCHRTTSMFDSPRGAADTAATAKLYLNWPCGVIRGALMALGVDASVEAELLFPQVSFHVHTTVNN